MDVDHSTMVVNGKRQGRRRDVKVQRWKVYRRRQRRLYGRRGGMDHLAVVANHSGTT